MPKKNQYSAGPAQDPAKRAQQIRSAIANNSIKNNEIIEDILALIDEITMKQQRKIKEAA